MLARYCHCEVRPWPGVRVARHFAGFIVVADVDSFHRVGSRGLVDGSGASRLSGFALGLWGGLLSRAVRGGWRLRGPPAPRHSPRSCYCLAFPWHLGSACTTFVALAGCGAWRPLAVLSDRCASVLCAQCLPPRLIAERSSDTASRVRASALLSECCGSHGFGYVRQTALAVELAREPKWTVAIVQPNYLPMRLRTGQPRWLASWPHGFAYTAHRRPC